MSKVLSCSLTSLLPITIARLNADGTVDPTLDAGAGSSGVLYNVVPTPSGGYMVSNNQASMYNNVPWTKKLLRLNSDGTLDQSFVYGSNLFPDQFAVQVDGKVICFDSAKNFVRYLSNGSPDPNFSSTGLSSSNSVTRLTIEPDGKILVVGNFTSFGAASSAYIVRLTSTGAPDATFVHDVFNYKVLDAVRQSDGKYVVFGNFSTIGSVSRKLIARLNGDGSLDSSAFFGISDAVLNNSSLSGARLSIQPNGKVLFSGLGQDGRFHYQNELITNVFRTTTDGTLDLALLNRPKGFYPYFPTSISQKISPIRAWYTTILSY